MTLDRAAILFWISLAALHFSPQPICATATCGQIPAIPSQYCRRFLARATSSAPSRSHATSPSTPRCVQDATNRVGKTPLDYIQSRSLGAPAGGFLAGPYASDFERAAGLEADQLKRSRFSDKANGSAAVASSAPEISRVTSSPGGIALCLARQRSGRRRCRKLRSDQLGNVGAVAASSKVTALRKAAK